MGSGFDVLTMVPLTTHVTGLTATSVAGVPALADVQGNGLVVETTSPLVTRAFGLMGMSAMSVTKSRGYLKRR